MKKITIIFCLINVLVVIAYNYSNRNIIGRKNMQNFNKIEIGMPVEKVLSIMGKPDTIFVYYPDSNQTVYLYQVPYLVSDFIKINLDSNDIIVSYSPPKSLE